MDLLSAEDRAEIRKAARDLADTFFQTPVVYYASAESMDRFNNDRRDRFAAPITLSGMVEFPSNQGDWATELKEGDEDNAHVKVTLNYEYLIPAGFVDNTTKQHKFKKSEDKFRVYGVEYKVIYADFDGPLDAQNVLVVLYGTRRLAGG